MTEGVTITHTAKRTEIQQDLELGGDGGRRSELSRLILDTEDPV